MTRRIRALEKGIVKALFGKRTMDTGKGQRRPRLLSWLYSLALSFFAIFYLPVFLKKGKHRAGFAGRFGRVPDEALKKLSGRKTIWVHGVSVGEVALAFRLVNALRERYADAAFLITSTTTAGLEVAGKLKEDEDVVLPFPVDFSFAVSTFVDSVLPRAVIMLETEIWPNLIFELSSRNIPIYFVNGVISDKAVGGYRLLRPFLRPVLDRVRGIGARDERMRARFIELGADPEKVQVTGNMKFDWEPQGAELRLDRLQKALRAENAFLWIVGSTHEGEDEIILDAAIALNKKYPHFRLLLAPRHLERLASIEALAQKKGVRLNRVSALTGSSAIKSSADGSPVGEPFWVLDAMGLLGSLYRWADAVFVGGSLQDFGGHNPVEPAYFEKPVLFGPRMGNFSEMAEEFKMQKAAVEVRNAEELVRELSDWIEHPQKAKTVGQNAKRLVLRHQGATKRNLESLLSFIDWRD